MMEAAYSRKVYQHVLQNGHFAIELALKAALSRRYAKHPHGHQLKRLLGMKINGEKIFTLIKQDPRVYECFRMVASAWTMKDRYSTKSIRPEDAKLYLSAFRVAYEWIVKTYGLEIYTSGVCRYRWLERFRFLMGMPV